MKFKTEQERLAHPLAGKIPVDLWSAYHLFNREITDEQLALLETPLESLLNQTENVFDTLKNQNDKNRQLAWICIVLANPAGHASQLVVAAKKLGIPDIEIYEFAIRMGHLDILKHLEETAPDLVSEMIKAYDYEAYRLAARNGHLDILKHLEEKAPNRVPDMIKARDYMAYSWTAENGHLDILKHLEETAPDLVPEMIKAEDYWAYRFAAKNGHLGTLKHLEEKAPDLVLQMIKTDYYWAYRFAAGNGHREILKHLEEKAPDLVLQMIKASNYGAYGFAAQSAHLDILKHLEEKAPDLVLQMIKASNYGAYRFAAKNGHLGTLKHLEEKAPDRVPEMIKANNYEAYRLATDNNHLDDVVNHLLSFPDCFSYAEMHNLEYGEKFVHPFVAAQLTKLRDQRQALEAENPDAVFDFDNPETAKLCFYMIRNLIRRNDPALIDDLRFLLGIPAVKALAHTAVTPRQENELLRLAMDVGNTEAASVLLTIPAVRQLAEQNNFYRAEARGELDLRALARDNESSMRALTQGEQKRMEAAIKHYQPMIQAAGINHMMDDLRNTLFERYNEHPATVTVNGKTLSLPAEWEAFQALKLEGEVYEQALKVYYEDNNHSALRYLSKPNHWMNANASYVNIDLATQERWSTFDEYQPLIAMLYLAAFDKSIKAIDGHTYEGRTDNFIRELSLIGRGHNWDNKRVNANGKLEEHDDLTADKPSCYSGVKRRLFQSVLGHPLISMLTVDLISQEVKAFVHEHFKTLINDQNREVFKKAIDTMANEIDVDYEKISAPLKELDIHQKDMDDFIHSISKKYGAQFDSDPAFKNYIVTTLSLSNGPVPEMMNSHLSKFYDFAGLNKLLESQEQSKKEKMKEATSASPRGLFAAKQKQEIPEAPSFKPPSKPTS